MELQHEKMLLRYLIMCTVLYIISFVYLIIIIVIMYNNKYLIIFVFLSFGHVILPLPMRQEESHSPQIKIDIT